MTAPALNIASTPTAQAGSAAVGASAGAAKATGPLAGFEALLTALFPAAEPGALVAGKAAAGVKGVAKAAAGDAVASNDKDGKAATDKSVVADDGKTPDTNDAAAEALAASLNAVAAATVEAASTAKGAGETAAPAGFGADKKAAPPAFPGLVDTEAKGKGKAALAGKAEPTDKTGLAAEAAPETEVAADAQADVAAMMRAKPLHPTLPGTTPAAAAATKASQPAGAATAAADDKATVQAKAAAATDAKANALADTTTQTVADQAVTQTAAVAAPPAALAPGLLAKPEPAPGPGAPAKGQKADRAKGVSDLTSVDASKPAQAADKPVNAQAADTAAKAAAASAEPEIAPLKAEHGKAEPDGSEQPLPTDTHTTAQTAAPVAPGAHAVRGSPETVANLAAQIVKKLEAKSTRFDLELNPQGLGKVDVRVEIGAEGRLTAAMSFDNAQAAADVKARAGDLHRALEQAGFDLSGGLSFDVASGGGQQRQAQQDQADQNTGGAFRGQAFRAALDNAGDAADAAVNGALRLRRGVTAGLDMRI